MCGNRSLTYRGDEEVVEYGDIKDMSDTIDRLGDACAEGTYAGAGKYGGNGLPKAGAEVGEVVGAMARAELASASAKADEQRGILYRKSDIKDMSDTIDRLGDAHAEGTYAGAGTYGGIGHGAYAEAGVGRARAEYSIFEAEAKGPNASAGAEVGEVVGAMARAELGSASANAGPVGVKLGLGLDTGASVGENGAELKVLGTGISIGRKTSVSVLGSEASLSCAVM